jgi:hypothetical protein
MGTQKMVEVTQKPPTGFGPDRNKREEDGNKRTEDSNNPVEDSNKRVEDSNNPAEDSNKRAEDSNSGPEDSNNPAEDSNRGVEDSNRCTEDSNSGEEDGNQFACSVTEKRSPVTADEDKKRERYGKGELRGRIWEGVCRFLCLGRG